MPYPEVRSAEAVGFVDASRSSRDEVEPNCAVLMVDLVGLLRRCRG
jgi:hypothetical protein